MNVPGGRLIVKENGQVGIGTTNLTVPFFQVNLLSRLTVRAAANTFTSGIGQVGIGAVGGSKTTNNNNDGGTGVFAIGGDASNGGLSGEGLFVMPGFADAASGTQTGLGADISGDVLIGGTLSVLGTKDFKIDHPLDPENKYLLHAAIESSEVLNVYSGNVITDAKGTAVVTLPEWFQVLNKDLRYQLTVIGTFAQAIVAEKVKDNRFSIRTNAPNVEVSWQVTGVRSDAVMLKHPFKVEEDKPERERGTYLSPEAFGQPEERGMIWARHPELMRDLKERRQKAQLEKTQPPNP